MRRPRRSAAYFGFSVDLEKIRASLFEFASRLDKARKIRAMVASNGAVAIGDEDVKPSTPISLSLVDSPFDATDAFFHHKAASRGLKAVSLIAVDWRRWSGRLPGEGWPDAPGVAAACRLDLSDPRWLHAPEAARFLRGAEAAAAK